MKKEKKGFLCVMSGGGFRAIECFGGVMGAFESYGLTMNSARASSGGCIPAAFSLNGWDIKRLIMAHKSDELIRANGYISALFGAPLYDTSNLKKILYDMFPDSMPNLVVTMTDVERADTIYAYGSRESIFCSMMIPEVFSHGHYGGSYWRTDEKICRSSRMEVVDGGVFDNIPVPKMKYADMYDHIFILVCNDDVTKECVHKKNRIGRSLLWINETMEREYRQIVNDWIDLPNVTIIKPPDYGSSMLSWSDGFGLYEHAYQYTLGRLAMDQSSNTGVFRIK